MIKSFADKHTRQVHEHQRSSRLPAEIIARAYRKLNAIDYVESVEELRMPPGNRLHLLSGNRAGQWSIAINDRWRVCFRFEEGAAYDVEIVDYH